MQNTILHKHNRKVQFHCIFISLGIWCVYWFAISHAVCPHSLTSFCFNVWHDLGGWCNRMPHQCSAGTKKTSCITQQDATQINRDLTKTLSSDDTHMHRDSTVNLHVTHDAGVKVKTTRCITAWRHNQLAFDFLSGICLSNKLVSYRRRCSTISNGTYQLQNRPSRVQNAEPSSPLWSGLLQNNSFFH